MGVRVKGRERRNEDGGQGLYRFWERSHRCAEKGNEWIRMRRGSWSDLPLQPSFLLRA